MVRLEVCLDIKEDCDVTIQTFGQREDALGELMRDAQRQFNEAEKVIIINDDTTKRRTCYNGVRSQTGWKPMTKVHDG